MSKILYTVGPQSLDLSEELVRAGADGARLTFSYGTPETQLTRARALHDAAQKVGKQFLVIADLPGNKPRLGEFVAPGNTQTIGVSAGEQISVVHELKAVVREGEPKCIAIPDQSLYEMLEVGSVIIVGDSSAAIRITSVSNRSKEGVAEFDCEIEGRRGIFIQNSAFNPECLTTADIDGLIHVSHYDEYDAVALSFVGGPHDIEEARHIMKRNGKAKPIVAKIETVKGVQQIRGICSVSDFVMIGRGDLALSRDWVEMPQLVDQIVAECIRQKAKWIMATQIAEGLNQYQLMTRAEMCDLWQWLTKGCFGILLSRETAWGPRPIDSVRATHRLAEFAAMVDAR
jgi:pyruvate kinase